MVIRKKSFGQHFLHDRRILTGIADAVGAEPGEQVVEIGPGTGRLTRYLVERVPAPDLCAIELDRDMIAHLAEHLPEVPVHAADACRVDWAALAERPTRLVGNLPYNASTAILFHALESRQRFRRFVFMFQKEVADRLTAQPGDRNYGAPAALVELVADTRYLFTVKPSAFRPPPKVDSAVVRFDPRPAPLHGLPEDELPAFGRFVHGVFKQPRKTLRNNLRAFHPEADAALEAAGLSGDVRPNTLDLAALVQLWRMVLTPRPTCTLP